MRRYPFLFPLIGLAAGTTCGRFTSGLPVDSVLAAAALLIVAAVALRRWPPFVAAATLLCMLWGNAAIASLLTPVHAGTSLDSVADGEEHLLEGVVAERPERSAAGGTLLLRLVGIDRRTSPPLLVQVRVREGTIVCATGDRVALPAKLRRPRLLGLPGEYDVVERLALRGIYHTASVASASDIEKKKAAPSTDLQGAIDRLAMCLGDGIAAAVPSGEGGVLRAMLLGERRFVSPDKEELYAAAGVNHVLSISGFHIALLAWAMTFLLRSIAIRSTWLLLRVNPDKISLLLTLPLIVSYLMLSGAAPATVRSVLMLFFGLALLVVEREIDSIHLLTASAFLMAASKPELLLDVSFQLSFAALWGMTILVPRLVAPFGNLRNRYVRNLIMFAAASIAATAATAIPVSWYFGRFSVAGIIANFAIVPLLGYGAVLAGFCALPATVLLPAAAPILFTPAAWCVAVADHVVAWAARIPVVEMRSITIAQVAFFLAAMILLTFLKGRKGIAGALAAALIGCVPASSGDDGKLVMHILSIGQAESIFTRLPDGRTILVDGGGSLWEGGSDTGKRLLVPALKKLGVHRIDLMVLTHPHPDHLKGLIAVAQSFPVGEFREGLEEGNEDYRKLKRILGDRKVPMHRMNAESAPFRLGEVTLSPLAPEPGAHPFDGNDGSLVLRLQWRRFSCLFTGDMGFTEEAAMLHRRRPGHVSILKVPHHGSRYACSVALVKAVSPKAAVVSAGYGNSFRLPSDDTVRQFAEAGIPLYRTDLDGTITVTTTGSGFDVRPWRGESRHFD